MQYAKHPHLLMLQAKECACGHVQKEVMPYLVLPDHSYCEAGSAASLSTVVLGMELCRCTAGAMLRETAVPAQMQQSP